MAKFTTSIKVDTKPILDALPKGCYVHGAEWDKETQTVRVSWEDDRFRSPYTFPTEFSLDLLQRKELPEKVTVLGALQPAPEPEKPPVPPIAPSPKRKR